MFNLSLASININSFNNSYKALPSFLNANNVDILLLQETHRLDCNNIQPWLDKHNLSLFSNAPGMEADHHFKSGTAILLYHSTMQALNPTTQNIVANRIQILTFTFNQQQFLLANVYLQSGKSSENKCKREELLKILEKYLETQTFDHFILAGDFNMTLHAIDTTSEISKGKDYHGLKTILKRHNLKDSYRSIHPNNKTFSYVRHNTPSRLDRFYTTENLTNQLCRAEYIPITFSDHSFSPLIAFQTHVSLKPKQSFIWKLNDSLQSPKMNKDAFHHLFKQCLGKNLRQIHPIKWWEESKRKFKTFFYISGKTKPKFKSNKNPISRNA